MSTNKITLSRKPKVDDVSKDSMPVAIIGPNGRAIKVGGRVYKKLIKESGGDPEIRPVGRPKNSTKYVAQEPPKKKKNTAKQSKKPSELDEDEDAHLFKKLEKMYFKLKCSQPLSSSSSSSKSSDSELDSVSTLDEFTVSEP